jgi:hypothetical protein
MVVARKKNVDWMGYDDKCAKKPPKETTCAKDAFVDGLKWIGEHVARGMMTGVGTILVYALFAVIIIRSTSFEWLRNAFGIRFSNASFANDASSVPAMSSE